ncbi:MAG: hypothetical protein KGL57_12415 [Burkholderiales bacterium]|nr:hypothetical protein [Burkholderiales bacterium]
MNELPEFANLAVVLLALLVAGLFKPWLVLKHRPLQSPWLGAMVILPWVWWMQQLLPSGVALRAGGACLLVLMFGWPLAIWSLPVIAAGTTLIQALGLHFGANTAAAEAPVSLLALAQHWLDLAPIVVWTGIVPASLALLIGLAIRRWLPHHLFIYILGRGFLGTAVAISLTGVLGWLANRVPPTMNTEEWLLGHWLLGWGEAISTGMLTSIFVAFKPQWLLTYSDARYLPPPDRGSPKG